MQLIQYKRNKRYIHGAADTVTELVNYYYKYCKHHGSMTIEDDTDNCKTLVTFGNVK